MMFKATRGMNTETRTAPSAAGLAPGLLLTRKQVAHRWRVCPHTVARNPHLKPIRLNSRLLRYRTADVEALEK